MDTEGATYCIVRYRRDGEPTLIKSGLTLEEAQEHCSDPETSSRTATVCDETGVWFDGYEEE